MNDNKKPKSRKQITSTLIFICPTCNIDLKPRVFIENVSGENFIKSVHECHSNKNCEYKFYE